jgi:hypothetical protein
MSTDDHDTTTPSPSQEELDELEEGIDDVRQQAADDLEPGGEGRALADLGVREQVRETGDTHHPLADR